MTIRHLASDEFWSAYARLPADIRDLADKNFALLKIDSRHPSLHFKDAGRYWSVRIGSHYRALAKREDDDFRWHWIGSHAEYDRLIR
jgi:hypothetical protein